MPIRQHKLNIVVQALEDETYLAEGLFFPEASVFGDRLSRLQQKLKTHARRIHEKAPLLRLHGRHVADEPEVEEAEVVVEPPRGSVAWPKPVNLRFPFLHWRHGDWMRVAYVPALGIEVLARNLDNLKTRVLEEIRFALRRTEAATSLQRLLELQRSTETHVLPAFYSANVPTPKRHAIDSGRVAEEKPVLMQVGEDLRRIDFVSIFEVAEKVERIAEILSGQNPRSLLLLGKSGTGKTALVYELVRRRKELQLGHTPIWETSGARIIAGVSGYGMWQERCRKLCQQAAKDRAIVFLGNLMELTEVGKCEGNTLGVAGYLRPHIARGELLAIAECPPEQRALIERKDPHLIEVFQILEIEEPSDAKRLSILLQESIRLQEESRQEIDEDAITTLDRLHTRYATYSGSPGRPVRFLNRLFEDRAADRRITSSIVTETFSRNTGLPRFLLEDSIRLDMGTLNERLSARVIGQPEASDLVSDLIAAVKTGLTRPRRPLASLLFIGPTGVGKTEMAKALAEVLFGDAHRLTRFDMSEFGDTEAVQRLISGQESNIGSRGSEGLLTAKVREQPFSVLLFDEFEKAHPALFDLFLQVLGEARLTDASGRVADFSNTVVIMTSNLGAEGFVQGRVGFLADEMSRDRAKTHFLHEVRKFFRPEFFNRVDRIVPFMPLGEDTVVRITKRELDQLSRRDGIRERDLDLDISEDVAAWLARVGFSPKYGARPLKRALERELIAPLAEELNRHPFKQPLAAEVRVEKEGLQIGVRVRVEGVDAGQEKLRRDSAARARRSATLRRVAQRLETSPRMRELRNEIYHLVNRLKPRRKNALELNPETGVMKKRLARLEDAHQDFRNYLAGIVEADEKALVAALGKGDTDERSLGEALVEADRALPELLLKLYALHFDRPNEIVLAVYGEDTDSMFRLGSLYLEMAGELDCKVSFSHYIMEFSDEEQKNLLVRKNIRKPREFLARKDKSTLGMVFDMKGTCVAPRLEPERGLHIFRTKGRVSTCLVDVSTDPLKEYEPPHAIERKGAMGAHPQRRTFDLNRRVMDDHELNRRFEWTGPGLMHAILDAIDRHLKKRAQEEWG